MTKSEVEKTLEKARKKIRKRDSCFLAIEEIAELVTELNLILTGEGSSKHLCEEISDVYITLSLLIGTYGLSRKKITSFKKSHNKSFVDYSKKHDKEFNIQSTIAELTLLQKVICKMTRGRKVKNQLQDAIASVELSLEYLQRLDIASEREVALWSNTKMKRMRKRLHHGGIV